MGEKRRADQPGQLSERFEFPASLPDGVYAARLLTSHSTDEHDKNPAVRELNLYFELTAGELSLIDALQFAIAANSHPAVFGKEVE